MKEGMGSVAANAAWVGIGTMAQDFAGFHWETLGRQHSGGTSVKCLNLLQSKLSLTPFVFRDKSDSQADHTETLGGVSFPQISPTSGQHWLSLLSHLLASGYTVPVSAAASHGVPTCVSVSLSSPPDVATPLLCLFLLAVLKLRALFSYKGERSSLSSSLTPAFFSYKSSSHWAKDGAPDREELFNNSLSKVSELAQWAKRLAAKCLAWMKL